MRRIPGSVQALGGVIPFDRGRRILAEINDFFLPQCCVVCGNFGASLHAECLSDLSVADGPRCARCWRPDTSTWCDRCASDGPDAPAFDALRTPFRFEGHARRALLEAKFRGITAHLGVLASAIAEVVPPEWRVDVIVPVPLHSQRHRKRGYNQSDELARGIARTLGARVHGALVARNVAGRPQASLTVVQRVVNARGAYTVRGVPPPRVPSSMT